MKKQSSPGAVAYYLLLITLGCVAIVLFFWRGSDTASRYTAYMAGGIAGAVGIFVVVQLCRALILFRRHEK